MKHASMMPILVLALTLSLYSQDKQEAAGKHRDADLTAAISLYQSGDYAGAIAALESLPPGEGDKNRYEYLGAAYAYLKSDKEARAAFKTSIKLPATKRLDPETRLKVVKKPLPKTHNVPSHERFGKAVFAVEFRADGTLGLIFLVDGDSRDFAIAALNAVKKIQFEPAAVGGKPLTEIRMIEYAFRRH